MKFSKTSLFVVLGALLLAGCKEEGCKANPNEPSGGDGPGGDVRAVLLSYGIYPEGECPQENPVDCASRLVPTEDPNLRFLDRETYILENFQKKYVGWLCVSHPEVPGRKLTMAVFTPHSSSGVTPSLQFDEGVKKSPICITGEPFDMVSGGGVFVSTKSGTMFFTETGRDLPSFTEWQVKLGFRVRL